MIIGQTLEVLVSGILNVERSLHCDFQVHSALLRRKKRMDPIKCAQWAQPNPGPLPKPVRAVLVGSYDPTITGSGGFGGVI